MCVCVCEKKSRPQLCRTKTENSVSLSLTEASSEWSDVTMSDNGKPRGANRSRRDPTMRQVQETLEIATSTKAAPEVIEGLKKALLYADLREDYTLQCTSQESDSCRKIRETTQSHPWAELKEQGKTLMNLTPMMLSGRLEGMRSCVCVFQRHYSVPTTTTTVCTHVSWSPYTCRSVPQVPDQRSRREARAGRGHVHGLQRAVHGRGAAG